MTSMKIVRFSRPSTPLIHLGPRFFHPLDLVRLILNERPSPLQMITNQLKENIIQEWLLYVTKSFLQVGFRFQYQLINLVWLSFGFILLSVQLSKNIAKCLLFIIIHTFITHFAINLLYLHNMKT